MKVTDITFVCPHLSESVAIDAARRLEKELPVHYTRIETIQELFTLVSDCKFDTDYVAIDVESFYDVDGAEVFDIINTLLTLIRCTVCRTESGKTQKRTTKILGTVGSDTDPVFIKQLLKVCDIGICMRIGGNFSYDDIKTNVENIINGDYSTPKKVQELMKPKNNRNVKRNQVVLTPRQSQVLKLIIDRGATNKTIAKLLKISESTVKLHMSAIFKKYGVKNRTQLAVFSKGVELIQ